MSDSTENLEITGPFAIQKFAKRKNFTAAEFWELIEAGMLTVINGRQATDPLVQKIKSDSFSRCPACDHQWK